MSLMTLLPSTRIDACHITVPGSKSYTNRALIAAALASGESTLLGASRSADSEVLIHALQKLGVVISTPSPDTILVCGTGGTFPAYHGTIDIGPAGTAMRFLTALCAAIPGANITLRGSTRMHLRPIGPLVSALRQAGATIDYSSSEGCPPLKIHSPTPLAGGAVAIDSSTSSQFISALLLVAPLMEQGLRLRMTGGRVSRSYIDMTLHTLHSFGLDAGYSDNDTITVLPKQVYAPQRYSIEGDASGATYLWAIAAVSKRSVTVENINLKSAQGDLAFPSLLAEMGCIIRRGERSITVTGPEHLQPIDADLELLPDAAQTLAVVAACAKGRSILRGLSTLRVKETDRIAALHSELAKVGIASEPGPDYLVIHGGAPTGARIATYDDHRMAMAFAVLAAKITGIHIENPEVVQKSFPDFWETLEELGIKGEAALSQEKPTHIGAT
jgi:3-phosphoshikimate 1-carboxyvinyltransferase